MSDWDGDGLADLVTSSAEATHALCRNVGTRQQPKLVGPLPLFCDGLDLHGTWRVRPVAATLGKSMAYVALDDQDQIHLWRRIDDQNLRDAGKLAFEDGSPIGADFLSAGGMGRSKCTLVEWDLDLLVNSQNATLMENVATARGEVVFRDAGLLDAAFLAGHDAAPGAGDFDGDGVPDLAVGAEDGFIYFLKNPKVRGANAGATR